jgi:hypothetical protein
MSLNDELYYIYVVFHLMSLITNMICLIVFIKILKTMRNQDSNQMFKYLLMKSICDMLPGMFNLLEPFYYYSALDKSYFMKVWYIWFNQYLSNVFYLASGLFEIAASFDCAISIENNLKWCRNKLSFVIPTLVIFTFCASFLSYRIFSFIIIKYNVYEIGVNRTETGYAYGVSYLLEYRRLVKKLERAEIFIRDFAILMILLIINIFIIFKMVQIRKRKSQLQSTRSANIIAAEQAENRKVKMIIFLSILFIFGHFPHSIYYILFPKSKYNIEFICDICFYISCSFSLLAYCLFNQRFKYFFLRFFKRDSVVEPLSNNRL